MKRRTDILDRQVEILQWIEEKQSIAFIAKQLECKVDTLKRYFKKMNIEYSGNQGGKGHKDCPKYQTAIEYMKGNLVQGRILRDKLIRDGLKLWKCECCGLTEWNDEPISLEIHHKDGNHYHNILENIELICPNCHAFRHSQNKLYISRVSSNRIKNNKVK